MFAPFLNARLAYDLYGPVFTGRPAVPIDWDLTYVWLLWWLLLILLLTPVVVFLTRGWRQRRADILSSFTDSTSGQYLLFFRQTDYPDPCRVLQPDKDDWTGKVQKLAQLRASKNLALDRAAAARARSEAAAAAEARARSDQAAAAAAGQATPALDQAVKDAEAAAAAARQQLAGADQLAQGFDPQIATAETDATAARRQWEQSARTVPARVGPRKTQVTGCSALLADYYDTQFGRRRFLWPAVLLTVLAGTFLAAPAAAALATLRTLPAGSGPGAVLEAAVASGGWVWAVAVAVLGGYTRVVFDLASRAQQDNVRPSDLLWGCFRLVIAVPLGYAVGKGLSTDNGHLALAVAFLLGLFPTATVMTFGRRLFYKWVLQREEEDPAEPLLAVPAVDKGTAEQLNQEGIANVTQLAYTDPVRLSIRSGLGFAYVVSCQSEALLAVYLVDRRRMDVTRLFGVLGAYEASRLWEDSQPGSPGKAAADTLINDLAGKLALVPLTDAIKDVPTAAGFRNVLGELAHDAYADLIRELCDDGADQ